MELLFYHTPLRRIERVKLVLDDVLQHCRKNTNVTRGNNSVKSHHVLIQPRHAGLVLQFGAMLEEMDQGLPVLRPLTKGREGSFELCCNWRVLVDDGDGRGTCTIITKLGLQFRVEVLATRKPRFFAVHNGFEERFEMVLVFRRASLPQTQSL